MSDIMERHRLTVEDYHKMAEVGILTEDDRIELIEGELIDMAPIGSPHSGSVTRLNHRLNRMLGDRAIVSVRNPIRLDRHNEPQPDIVLLRWRDDFYRHAHPTPTDILLLIEVADSSIRYDREIKLPLYARHGIPEVWLFNLPQRCLETHREPVGEAYTRVDYFRDGRVAPSLLPDVVIELDGWFGE